MSDNYIPRRDADLRWWAKVFSGKVAGQAGELGVPPAMVVELTEAYERFVVAYGEATNRGTRTVVAVSQKNTARGALEGAIRAVVRVVRAMPQVEDATLVSLGLEPRRAKRRRVPAPTESPSVQVRPAEGNMMRVRLRGRHSAGPGKPRDVAGATIYTYVGEHPPTEASQWVMALNTTTPRCRVGFAMGLRAGTKVWVTACWLSPTAQAGPMSEPVYGYLAGGLRFNGLRLAA